MNFAFAFFAAFFISKRICFVWRSSLAILWLLASPVIFTRGVITFVAFPPFIIPIFAVVSKSILPSFIFDIASAATLMADIPLSGAAPV